ncbi:hypothetical protein B0H16DRAFT_49702 [Mycena metata]|uniref:Uncharacterized protein n=1 Tax=Mycena metata TaxID=1033252 RepID=A0AAD7N139_9AGAR|nr:hypothetical protein B0H16DRAFT_49702 [Mycena metata]
MATTWFERSRKNQMFVKIHGDLRSVNNFPGLMKTLSRHSRRMRSLKLRVDGSTWKVWRYIFSTLRCSRSSRFISSMPKPQATSGRSGNRSGCSTMSLCSGKRCWFPPSVVAVPWQQLSKFIGDAYTSAMCLNALEWMSNLVECAFLSLCDWDNNNLQMFHHDKIQHLSIVDFESELSGFVSSANLLQFVTLPALQTLKIRANDFDEEMLDSFLARSRPPLQKLLDHVGGI